jgi:pimeloyl-ACP methyl ester carboxylesterase
MRLEVITELPKTKTGSTPLLFVHGMYCSALVWENFLPYFAEHGYEAHALSLRGHGASDGRKRLRLIRTAEYVADVAHVAGQLHAAPVLIGHSLGGYVIQKYLERHTAPAAVLLASVPVTGMFKMLVRLATRHPWQSMKCHLTWSPYAMVETPSLAREAFFSADMPAETLNRYFARLQNDSYCVGLEATFFKLPQPSKISPLPMLVLGAANDAAFSRDEVEATARAYKTQAEFFPNMAHVMMLESGWRNVAERILTWLREKEL